MPREPQRVLAVSAATGRIAYVYFHKGELAEWRLSHKASESCDTAYRHATRWLQDFRPELVILEHIGPESRKGQNTKALIHTIEAAAKALEVRTIYVARPRTHKNKYLQAAELAARYPAIKPWCPKIRIFYEKEPPHITLFEALAIMDAWRHNAPSSPSRSDNSG